MNVAREAVAWLRTIVFLTIFYGLTVPWVLTGIAAAAIHGPWVRPVAESWSRLHRLTTRWLLGQRIVVEGRLPPDAAFIVIKHEAMFETVDLLTLIHRPMIGAKHELIAIPLWGRVARAYGVVPIDREAGAAALRALKRDALTAMEEGRPLCLFPEGTRVPHGEAPPLRAGFAGLYRLLGKPVVPIAVDSGRCYPRGRVLRYPGTITYRIGETIPPGLPRAEAEARVYSAINALNATR